MRIVITGGAGFIGKKLARALLERGSWRPQQARGRSRAWSCSTWSTPRGCRTTGGS